MNPIPRIAEPATAKDGTRSSFLLPPSSFLLAWSRWVCFLDHREPGTSLALFRIACGLCVLGAVGSVVISGVVSALWLGPSDGGYTIVSTPRLFRLLGGLNPATLWGVIAVALLSGLLLTVGLGGRLVAFLALQSFLALADINGDAAGSYDGVLTNALWLLVLARSTATLSLDCRLKTGCWTGTTPVPAWPRYLAIYQLVLIYWSTGMHKISAYWTPVGGFSALYYTLQQPTWQRWDMSWLAWVYPLTQIGTALTWIWEITSPLLLLAFWYRSTRERPGKLRAAFNWLDFRRLFVAIGVTMHLLVFAFMEVGPFTWVTLAFYVCLFRPEEWQAAGQRLLDWCARFRAKE